MVVIFLNFLLHDGDSKKMPEIGFCLDHSDDRRSGCLVTKLLASLATTLTRVVGSPSGPCLLPSLL